MRFFDFTLPIIAVYYIIIDTLALKIIVWTALEKYYPAYYLPKSTSSPY